MTPYWNMTTQKELEKRLEETELVPVWDESTMLANATLFEAQIVGLWCVQKDLGPVVEAIVAKYNEYKQSYSVGGVHVINVMTRISPPTEIREKYGSEVDTYVTCIFAINKGG